MQVIVVLIFVLLTEICQARCQEPAFVSRALEKHRSASICAARCFISLQSVGARLQVLLSAGSNDEDEENINMDELQRRIDKQINQYYELLNDENTVRPETVYIIVFNPESEDKQGVHTIEFPKGSGNNVILAFESGVECIQFVQGLNNMQFYDPVPQETNLEQLEEFCQALGVPVKVVPMGRELTPPSDIVDEIAYNPNIGKEKSKLEELLAKDANEQFEDESGSWE